MTGAGTDGPAAGAVTADVPAPRLTRDLLTCSLYLYVASWSWLLSSFGPSLVLLRDELGVSRSVVSLHGTAVAAGSLLSAAVVVPLGRRIGRWALLQWSAAAVVVGVLGLVAGPTIAVTVPSALLLGSAGATGLNIVVPVLAQHHREVPSAAISEANAAGSTVGVLAPLAVGAAVSLAWGWRPALAFTIVIVCLAAALTWPVRQHPSWTTSQPRRAPGTRTEPFGAAFWCAWVAMTMFISIEFVTVYWSADLLAGDQGMSPGAASAGVSGFVGGMALGRWVVGSLAMRFADSRLLVVGLGTAGAGWLLLWTAGDPVVAVAGLALCGAGTGWLYPLGVSLMIRRSGGRTDSAAALAAVAAGLSSGGAPFLLASLADRVGTHTAFLVVPVAVLVGLAGVAGAVLLNRRRLRRAPGPAGDPAAG